MKEKAKYILAPWALDLTPEEGEETPPEVPDQDVADFLHLSPEMGTTRQRKRIGGTRLGLILG